MQIDQQAARVVRASVASRASVSLRVLAALAIGALLYFAQAAVVPIALAVLSALVLTAPVEALYRIGPPRVSGAVVRRLVLGHRGRRDGRADTGRAQGRGGKLQRWPAVDAVSESKRDGDAARALDRPQTRADRRSAGGGCGQRAEPASRSGANRLGVGARQGGAPKRLRQSPARGAPINAPQRPTGQRRP